MSYWSKPAAQNQNIFLIERFLRLQHRAVSVEHSSSANAGFDEFQGHQSIIHVGKIWPSQSEKVNFNTVGSQIINQ